MWQSPHFIQIVELHSEYEVDGFISFKDFCQIVTEKLNSEDDDFLIKSIFKSFKGTEQYNQDIRAPKRIFNKETLTFEEFKDCMKKLPEHVSDNDVREMFCAADTNGDGVLDFEEFGRMVIPSTIRSAKERLRLKKQNFDIEELRRYMTLRMGQNFKWFSKSEGDSKGN